MARGIDCDGGKSGRRVETQTGSLHCDKPRGPGDGERETGGWPTWQRRLAGKNSMTVRAAAATFPGRRPLVPHALPDCATLVGHYFCCARSSVTLSLAQQLQFSSTKLFLFTVTACPIAPRSRVRRVLKHIRSCSLTKIRPASSLADAHRHLSALMPAHYATSCYPHRHP